MVSGLLDLLTTCAVGAAHDLDSTDMDSAQHVSDCEVHTTADHDMDHDEPVRDCLLSPFIAVPCTQFQVTDLHVTS